MAAAPLYYLLPEHLAFGMPRWSLLVIFLGSIIAFESYRHLKGFMFIGLRPHEKHQIASFVWAAAGIALVLWAFPPDIASAALVGMAIVDPLAGEMRSRGFGDKNGVIVSLAAYLALCGGVLLLANARSAVEMVVMCPAAALIAVASERVKVTCMDDDFLMSVLPAAAMTGLGLAL